MYELLRALEITAGDEVIVQAFTCVAAINPIQWVGAKPVFTDIDRETLSVSIDEVKSKVTENTKMIVLQHTFGYPGAVKELREFADRHDFFLLEDCTQTLFAEYNPEYNAKYNSDNGLVQKEEKSQYLGEFGDGAIFSFGRDKPVSGIDGGVLSLRESFVKENLNVLNRIEKKYADLAYPPFKWICKELIYAPIWYFIKQTFTFFKIGKLFHFLFTKLGLLSRATSPAEKVGQKPRYIPAKLPNALAGIAWRQLQDIDEINKHRRYITEAYIDAFKNFEYVTLIFETDKYPLLRFPMKVTDKQSLLCYLKNNHIYTGDWYETPIAPREVDPRAVGYNGGECTNAEEVGVDIVNLPTHINISNKKANKIIYHIRQFYELRH
jgi:dTDP-4-amino-4,6-dideoxygalactose transaminase